MLIARNAAEEHAAIVDGETALHVGVGLTAGVLGISVTAAVLASLGAEFVYLAAKRGPHHAAFDKVVPASSIANHAADVIATVGGVYLGRWLVQRVGGTAVAPVP